MDSIATRAALQTATASPSERETEGGGPKKEKKRKSAYLAPIPEDPIKEQEEEKVHSHPERTDEDEIKEKRRGEEQEGKREKLTPRSRQKKKEAKKRKDKEKDKKKEPRRKSSSRSRSASRKAYHIETLFGEGREEERVDVVVDSMMAWDEFVRMVTSRLPPLSIPAAHVAAGKKLKFVFRHPEGDYELRVNSDLTFDWFLVTCDHNIFGDASKTTSSPRQQKIRHRLWLKT